MAGERDGASGSRGRDPSFVPRPGVRNDEACAFVSVGGNSAAQPAADPALDASAWAIGRRESDIASPVSASGEQRHVDDALDPLAPAPSRARVIGMARASPKASDPGTWRTPEAHRARGIGRANSDIVSRPSGAPGPALRGCGRHRSSREYRARGGGPPTTGILPTDRVIDRRSAGSTSILDARMSLDAVQPQ